MVERYRRKGRQKLMGNHQKCWIWGKNPVLETLRAGKWHPYEILCGQELPKSIKDEVHLKAEELDIPVLEMTFDDIEKVCHTREHQGLAAKMPSYPYDSPESISNHQQESPSLLIVLDSIQDPHNLGAIIRTAEVLGSAGIVIGKKNQAGVNSQVVRSSAGAVSHLPVIQVDSLTEFLQEIKSENYSVVAASEKAETNLDQFEFSNNTALIIGNEGAGIRDELLALADHQVSIIQKGHVKSLNAAVSASVLIYEFHRQLNPG